MVFCIGLFTLSVANNIPVLYVTCSIPIIAFIIAATLFFAYGIKITDKKVTLISQRMFKTFRYEDVLYINIIFKNNSIEGEIKAKGQPIFNFTFDGIDLGGVAHIFTHLYIKGLNLSQKFIDESIDELKRCEKVRIKNLCKTDKKEDDI